MELAKGGELFDKLLEEGCLSETMAARVITQVALVTDIYDEMKIIHLSKCTGPGGRS